MFPEITFTMAPKKAPPGFASKTRKCSSYSKKFRNCPPESDYVLQVIDDLLTTRRFREMATR